MQIRLAPPLQARRVRTLEADRGQHAGLREQLDSHKMPRSKSARMRAAWRAPPPAAQFLHRRAEFLPPVASAAALPFM